MSRSATHHMLPTRHEALVDDLQRDARYQPSEPEMITERHAVRSSARMLRVRRLTLHA